MENRVDAVLRTHGLALDEEPEELLAKANRRESKFKPGQPGKRRVAQTPKTTKKASKTKASAKKPKATKKSPKAKKAPKRKTAKKSPKAKKAAKRKTAKKSSGGKKAGKGKLTQKQRAQRQYAAQMRVLRKRAAETPGGSGPIAERDAAKKLRKDLGIKRSK